MRIVVYISFNFICVICNNGMLVVDLIFNPCNQVVNYHFWILNSKVRSIFKFNFKFTFLATSKSIWHLKIRKVLMRSKNIKRIIFAHKIISRNGRFIPNLLAIKLLTRFEFMLQSFTQDWNQRYSAGSHSRVYVLTWNIKFDNVLHSFYRICFSRGIS